MQITKTSIFLLLTGTAATLQAEGVWVPIHMGYTYEGAACAHVWDTRAGIRHTVTSQQAIGGYLRHRWLSDYRIKNIWEFSLQSRKFYHADVLVGGYLAGEICRLKETFSKPNVYKIHVGVDNILLPTVHPKLPFPVQITVGGHSTVGKQFLFNTQHMGIAFQIAAHYSPNWKIVATGHTSHPSFGFGLERRGKFALKIHPLAWSAQQGWHFNIHLGGRYEGPQNLNVLDDWLTCEMPVVTAGVPTSEFLKKLPYNNVNVNKKLKKAVETGDSKQADNLLQERVDPNNAASKTYYDGEIPLFTCLKTGDVDTLNELIQQGDDLNVACIINGQALSPLQYLILNYTTSSNKELNLQLIQKLFQHGARVDVSSPDLEKNEIKSYTRFLEALKYEVGAGKLTKDDLPFIKTILTGGCKTYLPEIKQEIWYNIQDADLKQSVEAIQNNLKITLNRWFPTIQSHEDTAKRLAALPYACEMVGISTKDANKKENELKIELMKPSYGFTEAEVDEYLNGCQSYQAIIQRFLVEKQNHSWETGPWT